MKSPVDSSLFLQLVKKEERKPSDGSCGGFI
jgi:hypothetical protein